MNLRYDIILGADFLDKCGITLDYENNQVQWLEYTIPLRNASDFFSYTYYTSIMSPIEFEMEHDLLGDQVADSFAIRILDAKYEQANIHDVAFDQNHLSLDQRRDLFNILSKHNKLFDGSLGVYPHKKVHIDLKPGAKPVHHRAYPVPHVHRQTFKKELDHMVELGILEPCGASEWASPAFIIPKKDGRVRQITDLRTLNKNIIRKQYPLPIITDMLDRISGYKFFTKLDISMQYYTFELDEPSQELCVIVTPFGKYKYKRLPMGLKCAPDFAQQVMEEVLRDVDDTGVYLDDIGAFSFTWEHHMLLLDKILHRLEANGFTVNPLKCEWAIQETDWLGYWLTPTGLKPWRKKIDGILQMQKPKNLSQMRGFLGAVNHYRRMWPQRAHILAPLSSESGKKTFRWTPDMDLAFKRMKALMARDCLLAYPNHNKPFHIYTDASSYQMGAYIVQDDKPVAYWSRKLNDAQSKYTVGDKELLSIVMVLTEFRTMLLGAVLHIHTDHLNITTNNTTPDRVIRWLNYVEQYNPYIHFIPGKDNVIADTLSRLDRLEESVLSKDKQVFVLKDSVSKGMDFADDPLLIECFLHLPPLEVQDTNPTDYQWIFDKQNETDELVKRQQKFPDRYFNNVLDDKEIICYVAPGDDRDTQWKFALTDSMIRPTLHWFHAMLGHPGSRRMRATLQARYHHPHLRMHIERFACDICQRVKPSGPGHGLLPDRDIAGAPWEEVAVDLIGPWPASTPHGTVEFFALTCIDTTTNLVEVARIFDKTSDHVATRFEHTWLSRYPKPMRVIHDNGGEFQGFAFQNLLRLWHIKPVPTTNKNPQSNAICERMHQTVATVLKTLVLAQPPQSRREALLLVDDALAAAMHALRSTVSTTLQATPGGLAFSRDMFLNIPLLADWQTILARREQLVNDALLRANKKRINFDYQIGQQVLKYDKTLYGKLKPKTTGPFDILRVHSNGTVTISLRPGITERVNVRRTLPYREPTPL